MPDTRPDLRFDEEGVCDACRSSELKFRTEGGIDLRSADTVIVRLLCRGEFLDLRAILRMEDRSRYWRRFLLIPEAEWIK